MKAEFRETISIELTLYEFFDLDADAQMMILNALPIEDKARLMSEMNWAEESHGDSYG